MDAHARTHRRAAHGRWVAVAAGALLALLGAPAAAWAGQTYLVTSPSDSGSGSLRAAITSANANPGTAAAPDTITLAPGATVPRFMIDLQSALPQITGPVILDGQGGITIIDPFTTPSSDALVLAQGSDGSTVRGLSIAGASGAGLSVLSSNNTIEGNTIGSASGANGFGLAILGANNTIGGTTASTANVISGNTFDGVLIQGAAATGNTIEGNLIGTDSNGLSGTEDPDGENGVQFVSGASGNSVLGGVVIAGSSSAIDAGGGANQVERVSFGGGPAPLIVNGQGVTVAEGTPAAIAGGVSFPVTVANATPNTGWDVDLLAGSCIGHVADLQNLAEGFVQTGAGGTGSGTVTLSGAEPAMWVFLATGGAGVGNLANPCAPTTSPPPPPPVPAPSPTPSPPMPPSPTCAPQTPAAAGAFAPSATDPNARWVQAVYHDLLGRAPSPAEQATFTTLLGEGVTRAQVASLVLSSTEYRADLVTSYDTSFLGHSPTAAALDPFVNLLASGAPDEPVLANILGSAEYLAHAGGTNPGFVVDAYCDLLLRAPSPGEEGPFLTALAGSTTRTQVAQALLSSAEYRDDLVRGWYLRFLRRAGSATDRSLFDTSLADGATDEQVIGAIVGSDEYFQMFAAVAVPPASITQRGVLAVTLPQPAMVDVQVFRLINGGTANASAQGARVLAEAAAAHVPKLKLVGTVHFGRHGKGRVALRWNRKVGGHKLRRGTYELIVRLHQRHKLIAVSDPVTFVVR